MRLAILLVLSTCAAAAPRVDKVEPPNWWVGHTQNPVQILLTGSDLKGASVPRRRSARDSRSSGISERPGCDRDLDDAGVQEFEHRRITVSRISHSGFLL